MIHCDSDSDEARRTATKLGAQWAIVSDDLLTFVAYNSDGAGHAEIVCVCAANLVELEKLVSDFDTLTMGESAVSEKMADWIAIFCADCKRMGLA